MKKSEQLKINNLCMDAYNAALDDLKHLEKIKRLRSCSAVVVTTENYYILKSYNTVVAVIDRKSDTLYDVLRIVYGFTRTSAQHIAKFNQDYCQAGWTCEFRYIAR